MIPWSFLRCCYFHSALLMGSPLVFLGEYGMRTLHFARITTCTWDCNWSCDCCLPKLSLLKLPLETPNSHCSQCFCVSVALLIFPPEDSSDATDCICNEVTRNHPITRLVSCGFLCPDCRYSFTRSFSHLCLHDAADWNTMPG